MTTLVHLSDLHFGRLQPETVEPLLRMVRQIRPRVTIVSGDLTQRARTRQFQQARKFLNRLPAPQIIVPGNHDVPLHNVFRRFIRPLANYKRYITDDLLPFYQDDAIAVLGINTARSLTLKSGRINRGQMNEIQRRMEGIPDGVVKIVVTHHPFDLPENADEDDLVGRAEKAMGPLSACGVDLLLAGHMHVAVAGGTSRRYQIEGYSAIFVQAGTAISSRVRGVPNSFNVLHVESGHITIECLEFDTSAGEFMIASTERFERTPHGWDRLPAAPHELPE